MGKTSPLKKQNSKDRKKSEAGAKKPASASPNIKKNGAQSTLPQASATVKKKNKSAAISQTAKKKESKTGGAPEKTATARTGTSASTDPGNKKPAKLPLKQGGKNPPAAKGAASSAKETPDHPARTPEKKPAESKEVIHSKLISLKRKMHREIFERCLEKHFFSNITEWDDDVAIPEKEQELD